MDTLKVETRALHARLDAHPRLARLLAKDLSVPEYVRVLQDFHGFWAPREAELERFRDTLAPRGVDLAARRKTPWLAQDLAYFGRRPGRASPPPAPADLADFGAACGCLYVLEGSTLGGQVIARHLRRKLALTPQTGARYFTGYGDETAVRWQELRAALERVASDGLASTDAMVAGAKRTFTALEETL